MSDFPKHASVVNLGICQVTTAETALTGTPTNKATGFSAGASGSKVTRIRIKATETLTAGMIRAFLLRGGTYYLIGEFPFLDTTAPSATVIAQEYEGTVDWDLETGDDIVYTTEKTDTYNIFTFGADY